MAAQSDVISENFGNFCEEEFVAIEIREYLKNSRSNLGLWPKRWLRYASITRPLWGAFPELLAIGLHLAYPKGIKKHILSYPRELYSSIRKLLIFFLKTEPPRPLNEKCDVILIYHQPMTNAMQPMLALAEQLQQAGLDCLVWGSYHGAVWWKGKGRAECNAQENIFLNYLDDKLMVIGFSRFYAFKLLGLSALGTAALGIAIIKNRAFNLMDILINPFVLWLKLLRSAHHRRAADYLMNQLNTKVLLVTYDRYSPASEFLLTRRAKEITTLHYHHGFSSIFEIPYLTKEVLVWNQIDADILKQICPAESLPKVTIVGNIELDLSIAEGPADKDIERLKQNLGPCAGKPVFLFLSQYVPALDEAGRKTSTEKAIHWLSSVAQQCPSWHFVVKEHHPADQVSEVMQAYGLLRFKNVSVLPFQEATLSDLLHLDGVKVVAAVSSIGLFVTSGFGKTAVRMIVEGSDIKLAAIDDDNIVYQARSPQELIGLLEDISKKGYRPERVELNDDITEKYFPFKGGSLQRITQLCLKRLARQQDNGGQRPYFL